MYMELTPEDTIKDLQRLLIDAIPEFETLKKERKGDRDVRIEIIPFYNGNQYIMFEYDVYRDVRLAACPPWGIGKYGADTDNWTWPRHKGDFCIFRVYTSPDGKPAKYSEDNVPMKSKHYLPINIKGVEQGDYAMIMGYPGSTDRYSTSRTISNNINEEGPAVIDCRTTKLNEYRKHMDADQEVFIKYASKQASVSNYWNSSNVIAYMTDVSHKKKHLELGSMPMKIARLNTELSSMMLMLNGTSQTTS